MANTNKSKKGIFYIAGAGVAVVTVLAVILAIIIGILIFDGDSGLFEENVLSEAEVSEEILPEQDMEIPSEDTIVTESSSPVSEDLSMKSEYNEMYAGLLAGDVTYEELEFVLSVVEKFRMEQGESFLISALTMIREEPSLPGVYEPIAGTSSYDAEHLDRILSPVTIVRISESTIPEFAELTDGVLTLHQASEPGEVR